ncbi:phytanoyl-CoA dioxygenase family protein [Aquimarina hainanensis]|uniref:Phytanoyl-CoA dioxygenase family protein n=1 Tax=Aquimarina hainanensis TaxID=1578017 RepID=A0ABW5NE28_9FLAO|nr:phytanoyl-CoA dioxygenase family protein [Aquimarina sp. TRL1]QKX07056.1 hypothetical protein HN014_19770 [Aquimarina sp. TRL1]
MTLKKQFNEDGFIIFSDPLFDKKSLELIRHKYTNIFKGKENHSFPLKNCWNIGNLDLIQKIDQSHLYDPLILNLLKSNVFGKKAAEITNATRISICATHFFFKPCNGSMLGNIGWHTDSKYVDFENGTLLGAWIPISDVSDDSGTLTFLKKSHFWKQNNISPANDGMERNLKKQATIIQKEAPVNYKWEETPMISKSGGLSFHHNNVWHYSQENTSSEDRMSISIALFIEEDNQLEKLTSITNKLWPISESNNSPIVIYDRTQTPLND